MQPHSKAESSHLEVGPQTVGTATTTNYNTSTGLMRSLKSIELDKHHKLWEAVLLETYCDFLWSK